MELPAIDGTPAGPGFIRVDLDRMVDHHPSLEPPTDRLRVTVQQMISQFALRYRSQGLLTGNPQLDEHIWYLLIVCRYRMSDATRRIAAINAEYLDCHRGYVEAKTKIETDAERLRQQAHEAAEVCLFEPTVLTTPQKWRPLKARDYIGPSYRIKLAETGSDEPPVRPPTATGVGMKGSTMTPAQAAAGNPEALESFGPGLDEIYEEVRLASRDLGNSALDTSDFWDGAGGRAYRLRMVFEIGLPGELLGVLQQVVAPARVLAGQLRQIQSTMDRALAGLDGLTLDGQPLGRDAAMATVTLGKDVVDGVTFTPGDQARYDRFADNPEIWPHLADFLRQALNAAWNAASVREEFQARLAPSIDRAEAYKIPEWPSLNVRTP